MNRYASSVLNVGTKRCMGMALVGMLTLAGAAHAETKVMVCELRGGQETPPNASPARGSGRFVINTTTNTISYRIAYGGLTAGETAAHFHLAPPGVAGPVKIGLPAGQPKAGTVTYLEADEADILAGRWYVNIHTAAFPGGEIRGQVNSMCAALDSAQEVPPNGTPSRGWATFNIDTCNNKLDYYIMVEGLSAGEVAAHIHGMSMHGINAGVIHTLPGGMIKVGSWNYNESQERAILAGQTYVNVHTAAFPGGEIRGQITPTVVVIDAGQEVPPTPTVGTGIGLITIDPPSNALTYHFMYGGTTGPETASHIHGYAPAGVNAGVVHALPPGTVKLGMWAIPAANVPNVLNGLTYINVHTAAFPGGEIRGQILFPQPPCPGDTNCDGQTNVSDLLNVITAWGPCPANPAPCPSDRNYDGLTNVADLLSIISAWGACP